MPASAIDILIAALDVEGERAARRIVARLARRPAARAPLAAAVLGHRSIRVRRWACEALAALGDPACLSVLARAAADPAMSVRLHALIAATRFRTPRVATLVARLIADPSGGVRVNAVDAASELLAAHPRLLRPLLRAARDPQWYVRQAAARALRPASQRSARTAIAALADDPHPAVRRAASGASR